MPTYEALEAITKMMAQAAIGALFISLVIGVIAAWSLKESFWHTLLFVMPFGWLGTISGLIAGSSREAIVGALLTGMLTIVGAMLSYVFAKESREEWRRLLPFSVILLSAGALLGLTAGQVGRSEYEAYEKEYERWLLQYENADLPAIALRIRYMDCVKRLPEDAAVECADILTGKP